MDIIRWPMAKSYWLYSLQPKMEKLYTVSKNKIGSRLWLRSWTPYCQIQTEIEESGENHQTIQVWPKSNPFDYTVEVRNRFKGLDLIDKSAWWTMDEGLWHCTEDRNQNHPQEKEMQKSKMSVWGGLTNSCEKKGSKKQRRKGKIYPFECRVPKNSKER